MRSFAVGSVALGIGMLVGCDAGGEMSVVEALDALDQVNQSGRGTEATTDAEQPVEVETDFTIGGALEAAANEIAAFWESQAPCTEVTVSGDTVTVDYGTLEDACTYRGHTYAGVNTTTVLGEEGGVVSYEHGWDGFSNGDVRVDGLATVDWTLGEATWRTVTDHTWTDEKEPGVYLDVHGDHVVGPLADAGWLGGFTLDGAREWTTPEDETWTLEMSGLELRYLDPAPQAGSTTVISPSGKSLDVTYARVDEDTISATLTGIRGGVRVYHISRLGIVSEADGGTAAE